MSSTPNSVGECIMFSEYPSTSFVCPFVYPSIRTDLVTKISHERLEQSRWNLHGIFTSPYWWPD